MWESTKFESKKCIQGAHQNICGHQPDGGHLYISIKKFVRNIYFLLLQQQMNNMCYYVKKKLGLHDPSTTR